MLQQNLISQRMEGKEGKSKKKSAYNTAVFEAVKLGDLESLKNAIAKTEHLGVFDVNMQEFDNWTPLMTAAGRGYEHIVKYFLTFPGVNKEIRNSLGETALIKACHGGKLNAAIALIEDGADVNAADDDSMTALILASSECYFYIVCHLLDAGANVLMEDRYGRRAIDCAYDQSNFEIIRVLALAGSDLSDDVAATVSNKMANLLWEISLLRSMFCLGYLGVFLAPLTIEELWLSCLEPEEDAVGPQHFGYNPAIFNFDDDGDDDDDDDDDDGDWGEEDNEDEDDDGGVADDDYVDDEDEI